MRLTSIQHWPPTPMTSGPKPQMSAATTVRTYLHPRLGELITLTDADAPNVAWLRSDALEKGLVAAGFLRPLDEAGITCVKPKRRKRAAAEPKQRRTSMMNELPEVS